MRGASPAGSCTCVYSGRSGCICRSPSVGTTWGEDVYIEISFIKKGRVLNAKKLPKVRLFLDYTYGLDKIYTELEIAAARRSSFFEREYNLKYLWLIGNVFHYKDITRAIEEGSNLSIAGNSFSNHSEYQKLFAKEYLEIMALNRP